MIVEPERYVKRFAEVGSDIVTFHYEATNAAHRCIDEIHATGARAGISIKPGHLGQRCCATCCRRSTWCS